MIKIIPNIIYNTPVKIVIIYKRKSHQTYFLDFNKHTSVNELYNYLSQLVISIVHVISGLLT